jgi:hypothetical protein
MPPLDSGLEFILEPAWTRNDGVIASASAAGLLHGLLPIDKWSIAHYGRRHDDV